MRRLPWSVTCLSLSATGRAFGHTNSRRLFSLLGDAERRQGLLSLPPPFHLPPKDSEKSKKRIRLKFTGCSVPKDFLFHVCGTLVLPPKLVDTRGEHWRNNLQICNLWQRLCCRARKIAEEFGDALVLYFIDMAIAEVENGKFSDREPITKLILVSNQQLHQEDR